MDTVEAANFSIRKLAEPLGAEITGIDVGRPLSDAAFKRIEDVFNEHCVLVFRNQRLTPDAHTGFSRRFGITAPRSTTRCPTTGLINGGICGERR